MFLLIPLLSQPVAAIPSVLAGVVETSVFGPGNPPQCSITPVFSPYNAYDDEEDDIMVFECAISFSDLSLQGTASSHIATITVWLISVTPPYFIGTATTGTIYLGGSTGETYYEDTIAVEDTYDPGTLPRIYSVTISASVTDPNNAPGFQTSSAFAGPLTVVLS